MDCTKAEACADPNVKHRAVDFISNWATDDLDLLCAPLTSYKFIASVYFIGFGLGMGLFFLPDMMGRRGALKISLTVFCVASYFSVFSTSLTLKAIGFMMQGMFHVKFVTCFVQANEFMPSSSKVLAMTIINCFDSMTVGIVSALLISGLSF